MADIVEQYNQVLRGKFDVVARNIIGEFHHNKISADIQLPDFTKKDLSNYLNIITENIPKVSKSGNPDILGTIVTALENANVVKAAINTKRLEALAGNRVKKAASALSFYYKGARAPRSIADVAFKEVKP